MTIKDIERAFKENKTLVFPGEIAAKSASLYIAEKTKQAVFLDKFLSWDTFKRNCTLCPKEKTKAQAVHRIIFTRAFFEESASRLKYFYNKLYPESRNMAEAEVTKNLIHFSKALEEENSKRLSKEMYEDIQLIFNSYCLFLQENSLYEETYLRPDFSKVKNSAVLVFPSAYRDSDVAIAIKQGLPVIEMQDSLPVLNVYGNTFLEIKDTMEKVRELLDKGVNAGEIAITCTDLSNNLPHIINQAKKEGIEISGVVSKKLYETKSGKIFSKLSEIERTNASLDSLKALLLDPVFPIKNREFAIELVRLAIERKADSGLDTYKRKFADREDFYNYLEKLLSYCRALVRADSCNSIRQAFNGFQDDFLEQHPASSEGESESLRILSRCIRAIDELENALNNCNVSIANVFGLYCNLLKQTSYVSQSSGSIKVYEYPASAGSLFKHHFIIGCDDEHIKVSRTVLPFADRPEECQDISSSVLKTYCISEPLTMNICISYSPETYSATCSEPALFIEGGEKTFIKKRENDCYSKEEELFRSLNINGFIPLQVQKTNFEKAVPKLLKHFESDIVPKLQFPVKLSASQISVFETCPYRWLYSSFLKLKEEDFEVIMEKADEIGTVLHETFEEFFNEVSFFDHFEKEESKLNEIFRRQLKDYSYSLKAPDEIHIKRIENKYSSILGSIKDNAPFLESSKLVSTEKDFIFKEKDYVISGRIDCIMQTADGSYVVIDFKKKSFDKESLQLVIYSKALQENNTYAKPAIAGAFYVIEEQKYYVQWPNKDNSWDTLLFGYQKRVTDMIQKLKTDDYSFVLNDKTCAYCPYSRICRKRYVIK